MLGRYFPCQSEGFEACAHLQEIADPEANGPYQPQCCAFHVEYRHEASDELLPQPVDFFHKLIAFAEA